MLFKSRVNSRLKKIIKSKKKLTVEGFTKIIKENIERQANMAQII